MNSIDQMVRNFMYGVIVGIVMSGITAFLAGSVLWLGPELIPVYESPRIPPSQLLLMFGSSQFIVAVCLFAAHTVSMRAGGR